VILATVGTHFDPFPRFFALLGELGHDGLVLQYGHNPRPAGAADARAFVAFAEMTALMAAADAVITHAGVGSILCARDAGHVPVVVPRLHALGEHVDDHQSELTVELERRGQVVAVWEGEPLDAAVRRARPLRTDGFPIGERPIHAALRGVLAGSLRAV